jgi:hypothetical protein
MTKDYSVGIVINNFCAVWLTSASMNKESLLARLLCWVTLSPFFERFFIFRRAQRDSTKKTSKFGLNTIRRRTQGAPYADIGSLQDLIETAQNLKRVNI